MGLQSARCLLAASKQLYCIILYNHSPFQCLCVAECAPKGELLVIQASTWHLVRLRRDSALLAGPAKTCTSELHGSRTLQLGAQLRSEGYVAKTGDIKMSLSRTVRSLKMGTSKW